jgi:cell division transport system permease protein
VFDRLSYLVVHRALRNMRQSPFLCAAAVGTVAVSLAILAFFALLVLNVQNLAGHWSKEVQVVAYLDKLPEGRQLRGWIEDIGHLPEVEEVILVSREEAFDRFRKRLGRDADLLDGLESDILPASLEISLHEEHRTRQGVETIVARLQQNPALSDLRYGQDWLERFESFLTLLRLAGAILGGFLIFAALFIVANTIKLTLYARRDELEIMTLVGGTPLFIKMPFLLEGSLQGAFGGVLALGGAYALYQLFVHRGLSVFLPLTGLEGIVFLPVSWQLLVLAAGTLLGFAGSLVSLRKFVRI